MRARILLFFSLLFIPKNKNTARLRVGPQYIYLLKEWCAQPSMLMNLVEPSIAGLTHGGMGRGEGEGQYKKNSVYDLDISESANQLVMFLKCKFWCRMSAAGPEPLHF